MSQSFQEALSSASKCRNHIHVQTLLEVLSDEYETPNENANNFANIIAKIAYNFNHCISDMNHQLAEPELHINLAEACKMRSGLENLLSGGWSRILIDDTTLGECVKAELSQVLLISLDSNLERVCRTESISEDEIPKQEISGHWWWIEAIKEKEKQEHEEEGNYEQCDLF